MKKIIFCFFISVLLNSNIAVCQETSNDELARNYRVKAMKYENMQQTGAKMMFGGGIAMASGIFLISRADWETDIYGNVTTEDEGAFYGILLIPVSIGLSAGGTVLYIIGRKKASQYFKRAKNVSIEASLTTVGITYKF